MDYRCNFNFFLVILKKSGVILLFRPPEGFSESPNSKKYKMSFFFLDLV